MTATIINKEQLLTTWQGHRALTRKIIEQFPEKELFEFSIGGMRPFSEMVKEMISIAVPGLDAMVNNKKDPFNHDLPYDTKAALLQAWDEATPEIDRLYNMIPEERFQEVFNLFGLFNFPIYNSILYFIDNEVHHRGQGYVYLRALNIEPAPFWDRP